MPNRWIVACALVSTLAAAVPCVAQDGGADYVLRARVSKGDTCVTEYQSRVETTVKGSRGRPVRQITTERQRWTQRILDIDELRATFGRILRHPNEDADVLTDVTGVARTYSLASETVTTGTRRRTRKTPLQGSTFAVKRVHGDVIATSSPRALLGTDRHLAQMMLPVEGAAMLPGQKVRVGDAWPIDKVLINSVLDEYGASAGNTAARLIAVQTIAGVRCARIRLHSVVRLHAWEDCFVRADLLGEMVFAIDLGKLMSLRLAGPVDLNYVTDAQGTKVHSHVPNAARMSFALTNTWVKVDGRALKPGASTH